MTLLKPILISLLIALPIYAILYYILIRTFSLGDRYYKLIYRNKSNKDTRQVFSFMVVAVLSILIVRLMGMIPLFDNLYNRYQNLDEGLNLALLLTGISIVHLPGKSEVSSKKKNDNG